MPRILLTDLDHVTPVNSSELAAIYGGSRSGGPDLTSAANQPVWVRAQAMLAASALPGIAPRRLR